MKNLLTIAMIWAAGLLWHSCSEEKPGFYEGPDGITFYDADKNNLADPYPNKSGLLWSGAERDTVYFKLIVYGEPSTKERRFALKQSAYTVEDSVNFYKEYAVAQAGINYVSFDDPEMEQYYIVPKDSSSIMVPVILLYDKSIAGTRRDFRLLFDLEPTEDLSVFDPRNSYARAWVTFSQREY